MPQRYDLAWNAGYGYSFLGVAFIALRGVLSRSIVFVLWSFTFAGVWSVVHHAWFYRALRAFLNLGHRIVFNVNEWAG